jgi:hypothetical protein
MSKKNYSMNMWKQWRDFQLNEADYEKFIDALKGAKLNRIKQVAILGRVVDALGLEPSDLTRYTQKIKKGL